MQFFKAMNLPGVALSAGQAVWLDGLQAISRTAGDTALGSFLVERAPPVGLSILSTKTDTQTCIRRRESRCATDYDRCQERHEQKHSSYLLYHFLFSLHFICPYLQLLAEAPAISDPQSLAPARSSLRADEAICCPS